MSLPPFEFPFEREQAHLENGKEVVLKKHAVNRWTRGRNLYELQTGEFLIVEHAQGRLLSASQIDDYHALKNLLDIDAELPPKLQQLLDAGEWPKWERPKRELSYWAGKSLLKCEASLAAHDVVVADQLKVIVRTGTVAVQLLRGQLDLQSGEAREIRGEFIGALFYKYPVDPDRWWGTQDCIPPATVGILELQWPAGTQEMRAIVGEILLLVEPPFACLYGSGRRVDNRLAPTCEEQEAAENALKECVPRLEQLIVRLKQQLEELLNDTTMERLKEQKVLKVPGQDAWLAYFLREITGATQKQIAKLIAGATGGTTEQGTVSRWLKEVDAWIAQSNRSPAPDLPLIGRALAIDPTVLNLGPRLDGRTPRQREEGDDS